jgi:hypothetical protein
MKPVPRSYGVSGELKPVKPNSYGVVNMVSVLVSVADSYAIKPLPLKRFGMEAEVGIGLLRGRIRVKNTNVYRLVKH